MWIETFHVAVSETRSQGADHRKTSPSQTRSRIAIEAAKEAPIAAIVRKSPCRGRRRPTADWSRNPARGARRTTRASESIGSALEARDLVDVDLVARVEDVEDDRQRHRGLRRGDRQHEDREDRPAQRRRPEAVERDEVDVRGVEHELEADQDPDG